MITRDPDLPIGVFDSGVGGLTVARAIRAVLPSEAILYLGDTARVPYGNRGADTIRRYVLGAARTLTHHDIKALVVACNTATAYGMEALRETFPDLPIIGVVTPVAKAAAARTESGYIGVIGTRGTVRSRCYVDALNACDTDLRITQLPCPLFVPLAEEGWTSGDVPFEVARTYLSELQGSDLDTPHPRVHALSSAARYDQHRLGYAHGPIRHHPRLRTEHRAGTQRAAHRAGPAHHTLRARRPALSRH